MDCVRVFRFVGRGSGKRFRREDGQGVEVLPLVNVSEPEFLCNHGIDVRGDDDVVAFPPRQDEVVPAVPLQAFLQERVSLDPADDGGLDSYAMFCGEWLFGCTVTVYQRQCIVLFDDFRMILYGYE